MNFDLDKSIEIWLKSFRKHPTFEDADIEEIEDHIRDEIERKIEAGIAREKAFIDAIKSFGSISDLSNEMKTAKNRTDKNDISLLDQKFPKSNNPITHRVVMFQNDLKTALRNFLKNRVYGTINLLGLVLGMTSCLIISLYVYQELSYDKFHDEAEKIFRIEMDRFDGQELLFESAVTFPAVGPALLNDLPEVKEYLRILPFGNGIYRHTNSKGEVVAFNETNTIFADANFFTLFNFPLITGNPDKVLDQPHQIVLSELAVQKYFKEEDPIGKIINYRGEDYMVSGVMRDMPQNSHMNFDMILSLSSWDGFGNFTEIWGWYDFYTFVKLVDEKDRQVVESKMKAFMRKYKGESYDETGRWETLNLQPITDIHLYSDLNWDMGENGGGEMVYFLMLIAVIILVIAWVNFVNLATARAIKRAKEIGVRKTIGAQRNQLIGQFLIESFLYNLTAIILSVAITILILPSFSSANDLSIPVQLLTSKYFLVSLVVVIFLGTIASGIYPAILLTSFQPSIVLKGNISSQPGGVFFRKLLVTLQFTASVILIVGTLTVVKQLKFMKSQELGINIDQVMVLNAPLFSNSRAEMVGNIQKFKNDVLSFPSVESFSMSSAIPGTENFGIGSVAIKSNPEAYQDTYRVFVDYSFFNDLEVSFLSGRNYSPDFASDTSAVIINEVAMKQFQIENPEKALQEILLVGDKEFRIIGVIKSYHEASLRKALNPAMYYLSPYWQRFLCLKISADNFNQTLDQVKSAWKSVFPDAPLDYFFMDQNLNRHYRSEERFNNIFMSFAMMAIFVACLGLFGLASFTAEQSIKEISIRKVLGSSVNGIVIKLSKEFIKLIIIAIILAFPVAYFLMQGWLDGFAFKTELSPVIFVIAGSITLIISLITVSYQSIKAARTNPAEILKNE